MVVEAYKDEKGGMSDSERVDALTRMMELETQIRNFKRDNGIP